MLYLQRFFALSFTEYARFCAGSKLAVAAVDLVRAGGYGALKMIT